MSREKKAKMTINFLGSNTETVMPPYEYQKPQNGFGSAEYREPQDLEKKKELEKKIGESQK